MKSRQSVKAEFDRRGETFADWARRNGYKPRLVYAILSGQIKGRYGAAHDIAVKLGLKIGAPRDAA